MATLRQPIVGIFNSSAMAEHAIEELKDAGYANDQIYYSGHPPTGPFFEKVINEVEGEAPAPPDQIARGLLDLGVPEDMADYCAREFATGHPIISVRSPGHEQDAIVIFRSNGAHWYRAA